MRLTGSLMSVRRVLVCLLRVFVAFVVTALLMVFRCGPVGLRGIFVMLRCRLAVRVP